MLPGKKYKPVDVAMIAWARRWTIIVPIFIGGYVALVVSSQLKDKYRSEMLIQVVPQRVPDTYVRSTVTIRTEDRLSALEQQVMSRTQLEQLITEFNLYSDERARLPMQDVVDQMRSNVAIEVVHSPQRLKDDADAFYVRFTYTDRETATRVTERLGALFVDMNRRDRGDLAQATNNFLEAQLNEARVKLEEQERKLEKFREQNAGRLPSQLQFNMQSIQSTQLEIQALVESLARDRDRKLMLERLYTDGQAEIAAPPAIAPQAPPAQQADGAVAPGATPQQQLAVARDALARLEVRLKPEHPDIARLKRQIAELEQRVAEDAAASPTNAPAVVPSLTQDQIARRERVQQMHAEIESLDRQIRFKESQEQQLRQTMGEYQHRIEQVPGVESEWTALTRDYDTQQAAYKDLLTKSEQSKVAADLERRQIGEQFRVLDAPRLPARPIGITRLQVNAMGAAAGLVVGLLLAALLEVRDSTFHKAAEVGDVLRLPVLAVVPYVPIDEDRRTAKRQRMWGICAAAAVMSAAGYGFWALQLWKQIK